LTESISIHEPLLVNTLGHCAGAAVFGILLYLFAVDWRRSGRSRSKLSAIAAGLALVWNLGSLVALASAPAGPGFVVAISFSVLSLLPAVLLHISVQGRYRAVWISGYVMSAIAVCMHVWEFLARSTGPHYAALLLVTSGFSGLTLVTVALDARRRERRGAGSRLAVSMCLFLLAISFVHFGSGDARHAWSGELAVHHAGIPLALFVLLYDYRFLLLDAFLRFTVNAALAAAAALTAIGVEMRFHLLSRAARNEFAAALLFVAACAFLAAFAQLRAGVQKALTRVLFRRASVEPVARDLQDLFASASSEQEQIQQACHLIAGFFGAEVIEVKTNPVEPEFRAITAAAPLLEWPVWRPFAPAPLAEAALPIRFSSGDVLYLLLGPLHGRRPYLSEDIALLSQLGKIVEQQIERRRQTELRALASQAELRALQAQINPHFLFNSLNALYGTISRENSGARRLVLNLADVFRYFLRSESSFITVEEELKIVRAYLEIEELRLGPKLTTVIEVEESTLKAEIPVLSVQPLVENAVKHGVAGRAEPGFVRVSIKEEISGVRIEVSNSGEFSSTEDSRTSTGARVGMANVRRRLTLCYGAESELRVSSENGKTVVGFLIPSRRVVSTQA
jgi:two-component system, LytTR family, sensor kinase